MTSDRTMGKYFRQRDGQDCLIDTLTGCAAIAFRPGGHRDSFEGKIVQRAGLGVMFTLSYEADFETGLHVPVQAFCASLNVPGRVQRTAAQQCVNMDLRRRPRVGAQGKTIDPERNPTLLQLALQMDATCQTAIVRHRRLSTRIRMPRVLLGFAPSMPPAFQDSPELRRIAARKLGVSLAQLGRNGEVLLSRLLQDVWQEQIVAATAAGSHCGNVLVDSQLCPNASGFLSVFEDFSELLGVPTWNPVRNITVVEFANPAKQVWRQLGWETLPDFNEPFTSETVARAEALMRSFVPYEYQEGFTVEDLYDGLTTPNEPLRMWSKLVPEMTGKLPPWAANCCTDGDLRAAVRNPHDPLWLRYACRIQVVTRDAHDDLLGIRREVTFRDVEVMRDNPEDRSLELTTASAC